MSKDLEDAKEAIETEINILVKGEQAYGECHKYQEAANLKQERLGLEKALVLLDPTSRKKWKP